MMVLKEQLKDKIATIKREIESYEPAKQKLRKLVSTRFLFLFFFIFFFEIDRGTTRLSRGLSFATLVEIVSN